MYFSNIAATVKGKGIIGSVSFKKYLDGTWVTAKISGLPDGFFGFHLHEGSVCDESVGYASAGGHYNPQNTSHPYHAGDFPVLLSSNGLANMEFYTARITPEEAVGKTVIIHSNPDDFRTDPAGNSGERIACGIVRKN